MDNARVFYTLNRGSIPLRRTSYSGFGEMDIIFVFETKVMGSIPVSPARKLLTEDCFCYIITTY
jgi:hypothetical protein